MLTIETVQNAFRPFENGDPPSFFKNHVADDVVWTITGSDALSGKYTSKREVLDKTLNPVIRHMATPVTRKIKSILISGDWAIVEHTAEAKTKQGMDMFQEFCWLCRFEGEKIVEARMYMDTAMFRKVLDEKD